MTSAKTPNAGLPDCGQIRQAVEMYLRRAYGEDIPPPILRFLPPEQFDPARWLMSDFIEREYQSRSHKKVHSYSLRMGNTIYPHMKLRLTRPPRCRQYLFLIDAHDEILFTPAGSADTKALEELKRYNAELAEQIVTAMDEAGLPTERGYLKARIAKARRKK